MSTSRGWQEGRELGGREGHELGGREGRGEKGGEGRKGREGRGGEEREGREGGRGGKGREGGREKKGVLSPQSWLAPTDVVGCGQIRFQTTPNQIIIPSLFGKGLGERGYYVCWLKLCLLWYIGVCICSTELH